jgi:hypothetical protein
MKRLFVLFVVLHLMADVAMPSLPGAFRFDPDESVAGIRVRAVHLQDMAAHLQVNWLQESSETPRVEVKGRLIPDGRPRAPDVAAFLPRRDPSVDRSPQGRTEDH